MTTKKITYVEVEDDCPIEDRNTAKEKIISKFFAPKNRKYPRYSIEIWDMRKYPNMGISIEVNGKFKKNWHWNHSLGFPVELLSELQKMIDEAIKILK
jgi:hypothetical protein